MILNHSDPRCTDLALKRFRWAMAMSEEGDSHVCSPADMRMREKEAKFDSNVELRQIQPDRASKVDEQFRTSRSIRKVWLAILTSIHPHPPDAKDTDKIQGFGDEEYIPEFRDRSRAFYRPTDALDHVSETASAFLKGLRNNCEVAIPPRKNTILRCRRWAHEHSCK